MRDLGGIRANKWIKKEVRESESGTERSSAVCNDVPVVTTHNITSEES